ncbi:MAG: hypothetical protein PUC32_01770 [Oscillospiraceae bacterium]|nr:hypothetical protein [Oscillospiraceae bacterium]
MAEKDTALWKNELEESELDTISGGTTEEVRGNLFHLQDSVLVDTWSGKQEPATIVGVSYRIIGGQRKITYAVQYDVDNVIEENIFEDALKRNPNKKHDRALQQ